MFKEAVVLKIYKNAVVIRKATLIFKRIILSKSIDQRKHNGTSID